MFSFGIIHAQQIEKSENGTFLLDNATIVSVTKGTFKGDVLIKDGMIAQVASEIKAPTDAKKVDCTDLFVYPGMIDSGTKLGLAEISAISLTQDFNELGTFTPHMEALTAVNPNSVSIPVTRVSGVTTVLTSPTNGLFPGKAAMINLSGYTPEQMFAGVKIPVLNFPSSGKRGRWDKRSEEDIKKDAEKATKKLKKFWKQVAIYAKAESMGNADELAYNPQLSALSEVARGEAKILINANKKADILAAIAWANKQELDYILSGVAEGYRVIDTLLKYNIPVVTGPILDTPSRQSDRYDTPYTNAGKMQKAGVKVAIRTNETENVRNLPYHAAFAATYGMGVEEALKAVTIVPAEIFGIADKYGSIEEGKVANIFISDGDPFETKTQIQHLFIKGWKVPMESRHTHLYNEFIDRTHQEGN